MTWGMLEVYWKFRQSAVVGLPEKILHFTITETLQIAISECFQLILINDCWPNGMHVEQHILYQGNTPQGNLTILSTEVANLPSVTGSGGCRTPSHPPSAGPVCKWWYFCKSRSTLWKLAKIGTDDPYNKVKKSTKFYNVIKLWRHVGYFVT